MEPINTNSTPITQSYSSKPVVEPKPEATAAAPAAVAPKFISPKGSINAEAGTYTVQFRDTSTGEVQSEYPRKAAVSQYSKAAAQTPAPAPSSQVAPESAPKVSPTDVEA